MKNLIDTHFHLDHYRNYMDIATEISRLMQYTICVTNSPGVFLSCKRLIQETKYLKFAIGFHPLEDGLGVADLRAFLRLLDQTNYVGEIGLDYSKKSRLSRAEQIHSFESIVDRCSSENKLMTIHIRNAETDAIEVIKRYNPRRCIIHWFTGTEDQMMKLLDLGCYMSINTNMISNTKKRLLVRIPHDKVLIESDGPYTKVAGKKYSPILLAQAYQEIEASIGIPGLSSVVLSNFRNILED